MKKAVFPALMILTTALFITSCGPSREYAQSRPPRYRSTFSLIITPTPGFTMSSYPDGRYYHRTPQGFIYWKGYDNRFYLDRKYLGRVQYDQREYNEWKRFDRNYRSGRRR